MNFEEIKSGTSVEDSEILAYRSEFKASGHLYLIAGVHGDEVEGVYVLKQLYDWLLQHEELKFPIIVIPNLNPDGHRANTRGNSHGVDLNRNLPTTSWQGEYKEKKYYPGPGPASEPENLFLLRLMEKYRPSFILSFHSWKPLINYNGDSMKVAQFLSARNGYPIAGDIGYPTPGSLGDFGPEKYHAPVITFECPTLQNKSLKEIWEENERALKELLRSDLLMNTLKHLPT